MSLLPLFFPPHECPLPSAPDFSDQINRLIASSSLFDPAIEQRAREIIQAVRARGDAALAEFTERFDGAKLEPDQFAVSPGRIDGRLVARR